MKMPDQASPTDPWICMICMYEYHPDAGDPGHGVPPGTAWEDVPPFWCCPKCGAAKAAFMPL